MTRGDFRTITPITDHYSKTFLVDSGTTKQLEAGEPSKSDDAAGAATGEVSVMADGDGTTSQRFTGIAKSDSTETSAAAGVVTLYMPLPGIIYSGKAKSAAAADTKAEIDILRGKRVVFDLTSSAWTIDTAAADAVANCVVIVDGDPNTSELHFMYRHSGTWLNFGISA
ncbi:hypothetical protein KAR91_27070 [Candidatus Pacearchaeota archaeon]|nr:hypothetical protein [Candidatus Pacearchaeota archaeon]